jgi:Kef-type K+ transport system membrane component KefB
LTTVEPHADGNAPRVLLTLAAVIAASRLLGCLLRSIRQPRVIGEVLA